MGYQLLRGDHLNEEVNPSEMRPNALPRELIRCWDERYTDENGKEKTRGISLMRYCEVPQFRTLFFNGAMNLYNTWKLFKQSPPLGQGWGNERAVTCKILQILEVESNKYDAWERERDEARRKNRL